MWVFRYYWNNKLIYVVEIREIQKGLIIPTLFINGRVLKTNLVL